MKFGSDDDADSSQVEDRRGSSFGGPMMLGGGGLGIVGVIAYVVIRLLGGNVEVGPGGGGEPAPPGSPSVPDNQQLGGSCQGVTSQSDPAKFISCVVSNVQHFWQRELPRRGTQYQPAHLVLFTQATPSGCGTASAATGPFYCPRDGKVYLDLGFFRELSERFGARGGDFAQAYVVAHEYGHHIQDLLGIERRMRQAEAADRGQRNALSVRLELQADCFAGVWGHAAYDKGTVSRGEIAQALDAAAAVGDDRIQKETEGSVHPESFTHGSAAERQRWFETGMTSGNLDACDTFGR
ncbi:MAG: YpfJ protein, zinc metalloprotease superfamily protein [bacterium]|nr:YpfJ protein, zinc metalloprotease superfamily protein [bacterium]